MPKKKKGSGFYRAKRGATSTGGRNRHRQSAVDSEASCSDSQDVFPVPMSPDNDGQSILPDSQEFFSMPGLPHHTEDTGLSDAVLAETFNTLNATIPDHWKVIQDRGGFHAVCLSRRNQKNISIQRVVYASFDGSVDIFVHRKEVLGALREEIMNDIVCLPLSISSVTSFVDSIIKIVGNLKRYEICAGVDLTELEDMWAQDSSGTIDFNPYDEARYDKTFRSHDCTLLLPVRKWRCMGCTRTCEKQKVTKKNTLKELHNCTRNDYLNEGQKKFKLKLLQNDYRNATKKIDYLQTKVTQLMNQESVLIDEDLGENLSEILRESNLNPLQALLIQQQYKSAQCKNAKGMRWHPTMIRLALLIKSTSTAAYRALKDSGFIHLPVERTLYNYDHAMPRHEGIFTDKLSSVGEKVQLLKHEHQHFFSLLMDEIHISRKLVYRKSYGRLIGYVKLDEVDSEMSKLSESIKSGVSCDDESEPEIATKILAYMIKGCTNSIKEVVGVFTTGCLTSEQLFSRTWEVIRACEGVGVKTLAVVCDGSSVNRAFIAMHTPATEGAYGVVFDTVNMCALDRKIFFISDPPHLLKTIKNCFAKSGCGKKYTRLLTINNELIQWSTIVRLYLEDMQNTLRRSFIIIIIIAIYHSRVR